MNAVQIIEKVAARTDRVVLFHSAAGKDSIALLDMLSPRFKEVVCVFMYVVKDLEHIDKYIRWAERRYANARFMKIPHFMLSRYIKGGEYGIKPDPKQKLYNMAMLMDEVVLKTGIKYVCVGFKKSDNMNRRLMLNGYVDGVNESTKRFYPLQDWKNKDVLAYIKMKGLVSPIAYDNHRSSGVDVGSGTFLYWLKQNYPQDLEKVLKAFPLSGAYLFEYETKIQTERNVDG